MTEFIKITLTLSDAKALRNAVLSERNDLAKKAIESKELAKEVMEGISQQLHRIYLQLDEDIKRYDL